MFHVKHYFFISREMLLYVSRETLSLYYHFSPLIFDPAQKILYNKDAKFKRSKPWGRIVKVRST